jgi:NADH-quinone oxidoreductase subunit D
MAESLTTEIPLRKEELLEINMGPQHPSTHGVLRLKVKLNGEIVEDVEPILGYLHRSKEKLAEMANYLKFIPITDRMDYNAAGLNEWGYCLAVERLLDVQVPERAEYLRVIQGELNRIANHLLWNGTMGLDLGALTPFWWCLREREYILELLEALSGVRMHYNYVRFGGVKYDAPKGWIARCKQLMEELPPKVKELEDLLVQNDIVRARMIGCGVLTKKQAIEMGATGPFARASGLGFDLRRYDPYSIYDRFEFDIPVSDGGDVYARLLVRLAEIRESVKIIQQALKDIPEGPIIVESLEGSKQFRVKPRKGETYTRIESAKGELAFYLVSDGSMKPYRLKIRGPSYVNLQALPIMAIGQKIPDLVATLGSIDIVLGDVDR